LADLPHWGVLARLIIVKNGRPVQACYLLSLIDMTVKYSQLGFAQVMLVFLSQPVHYVIYQYLHVTLLLVHSYSDTCID